MATIMMKFDAAVLRLKNASTSTQMFEATDGLKDLLGKITFNDIREAQELHKAEIAQRHPCFPPETVVHIYHNNEIGEWLYSVVLDSDRDTWVDSFETYEAAVEFCEKNKLHVKFKYNV